MNAITIFRRVRGAKAEIDRLETQKQQRWDALTSISAPQADPNGGSRGGGDKDKNGRIMADIDGLERRIRDRQERLEVETVAALTLLDMLPDLESGIIHAYYLKRMNTAEIAKARNYTSGYVRKLKRQAEQILDILSEERVESTLPKWYLEKEGKRKDG